MIMKNVRQVPTAGQILYHLYIFITSMRQRISSFGNCIHHCPSADKGSFYGRNREQRTWAVLY